MSVPHLSFVFDCKLKALESKESAFFNSLIVLLLVLRKSAAYPMAGFPTSIHR